MDIKRTQPIGMPQIDRYVQLNRNFPTFEHDPPPPPPPPARACSRWSQFQKDHTYDWFCGPGSHMLCV